LHPRKIQTSLIKAIQGPGVYVLEAPMGVGKTEAALYAAYMAMAENRATGIYFALPTKLTSDKIYERMKKFLEVILKNDSANSESLLLHGSAWLRKTEIGEEGEPGRSWFNSSKRGLLAPFAVGTIDQVLMAAMNVKHGFVRTFGLAGKVVILDEVHSYDGYTGTLLEELIVVLREIHCTVIILSATLTEHQRRKLLFGSKASMQNTSNAYPLISAVPVTKELCEYPVEATETTTTTVRMLEKNSEAFEETLLRAERGEQVLWIENTVNDAQEVYKYLAGRASEIGIEHGLLHSRFIKSDREKNEKKWVDLFGKEGVSTRLLKGRILVGTQVLEQSLDIDADFMVTRICPTDMLLQRIGRLWRHRGNDAVRPAASKREVWILSPSLEDAISNSATFGKSEKVYSPYVLCRTLEVLENISNIILPTQIRTLIESTYLERDEVGKMGVHKYTLQQERDELRSHALIGVSRGGKTLSDNKAATRYSDVLSVDVLLFYAKRNEKSGMHLHLLDDSELILLNTPKQKDIKAWKNTAAELQRNTVSVPEYQAPVCSIRSMEWLKDYVYLGEDDKPCFRIAIVQADGVLIGLGQEKPLAGYNLCYDSTLGYVAEKV